MGYRELNRIQSSQRVEWSMLHQQILSAVKMGIRDRNDLPQARGNVGEESCAGKVEIPLSYLSGADQPGKCRMQFNNAEA